MLQEFVDIVAGNERDDYSDCMQKKIYIRIG